MPILTAEQLEELKKGLDDKEASNKQKLIQRCEELKKKTSDILAKYEADFDNIMNLFHTVQEKHLDNYSIRREETHFDFMGFCHLKHYWQYDGIQYGGLVLCKFKDEEEKPHYCFLRSQEKRSNVEALDSDIEYLKDKDSHPTFEDWKRDYNRAERTLDDFCDVFEHFCQGYIDHVGRVIKETDES